MDRGGDAELRSDEATSAGLMAEGCRMNRTRVNVGSRFSNGEKRREGLRRGCEDQMGAETRATRRSWARGGNGGLFIYQAGGGAQSVALTSRQRVCCTDNRQPAQTHQTRHHHREGDPLESTYGIPMYSILATVVKTRRGIESSSEFKLSFLSARASFAPSLSAGRVAFSRADGYVTTYICIRMYVCT